jgi:hypothetical protein
LTEDEKMNLLRENEGALRDLGHDPEADRAPRRVDFSLVFLNESSRSQCERSVKALGFDWKDSDEAVEEGTFEATAHKLLSPTAKAITESEVALVECLASFGAKVDGWGYFRDTVH